MPTGYTAVVQDGASFTEFAQKCAEAFFHEGMLPKAGEPQDTYYEEQLLKYEEELTKLKAMTREEAESFGREKNNSIIKMYEEWLDKDILTHERYDRMLAKVYSWSCPETIEPLKQFMLKQLLQSIQFDCNEESTLRNIQSLQSTEPIDVYELELNSVNRSIEYFKEQIEKQTKARQATQLWLEDFNKALELTR